MIEKDTQRKDASYINRLNKIEVLKLIRESNQISRAEIVKRTGLSAPTVTRIAESLINDKLAVMVGEGDSTGGRPPKLIKFDGSHNYVIGIDLGSTSIRGVISNLEGKLLTEIETPTEIERGFERVSLQVGQMIERLIDRSKLNSDKILGVGIAVAGLIEIDGGLVEYSPMFNWRQVDLRKELKKYTDLPVYYDNVSRVTALGELLHGVGRKHKNFILVNTGYGIGAGIIINGVPFYGSKGFTGEFGHIIIQPCKYTDKVGLEGSLEALSSGYGIAEIAKRRIKEGAKSKIAESGNNGEISAKTVIDAAIEGDKLGMEIFDEAMHNLGIGLDALIKLFNPEVIVLSGGLTKSGDIFFEKLRENIRNNKLKQTEDVPLLPSSFGGDGTLIGAFSLIITKVLQFETSTVE